MTKHLEGQRFGRLVVLRVSEQRKRGYRAWDCLCDCGNSTVVVTGDLLSGHTTSCGCLFVEKRSALLAARKKDLLGKTFGRLTVIGEAPSVNGRPRWLCACSCGKQVVLPSGRLLAADGTKSCGCLRKETTAARATTHGDTRGNKVARLYIIYNNMLLRCYNENSPSYKYYGERGIKVCDEWRNSYETFRTWALLHGYEDHLTIERIDVDGNYCPENCTWIPLGEQVNNRRPYKSRFFGGERVNMKKIIEAHGISCNVFYARIHRGWSIERALNTPVDTTRSRNKKGE